MSGLEPTRAVLKQLMVLTNNCCAFQDSVTGKACESHLYKPGWKQVNADICHIRGDSPGSARYDESMSPEDRRSFDNLIVLCPTHHNIIDNVRPDDFTVEVLEDMKIRAESRAESVHRWVPETAIDHVIDLVAARTQYLFSLAPMPQVIGLSAEIRGVRYPGTATIVSSPTATATGQGVNPEVHTSDGHPLAMLVHQVLGYDTKWTNGGDGSVWEFNLARPLTGEQQMRLADLANEQKIGMTFRYQDSQWRAEPQETQ